MGSVSWKLDNQAGKRDKRPPRCLTQVGPSPERLMANRAIWSMRLRHEWLKTPLKKARFKRSQRIRVGLEDALVRRGIVSSEQPKAK
jgi:hypothetical protein